MFRKSIPVVIALLTLTPASSISQRVTRAEALAKMPVKEVTVFKDGHAFMLHEGNMPVGEDGSVQLDYVPIPVLGTFWPYSSTKGVKLAAVTASTRRVTAPHTALNLADLLEANPGARVKITEINNQTYEAEVVGRPRQDPEERERLTPPGAPSPVVKSNIILLKTASGVLALPMERVQSATFLGDYKKVLPEDEERAVLSLKLDWPNDRPAKSADVGMIYLQKGIRWIPSYKVTIDGKGGAVVKLQATLINEMVDLKDVTANLVIGVPTFAFKDTQDPIGLQQTLAQLSPYFDANSRVAGQLSNSIMSQARYTERGAFGGVGGAAPAGGNELPEVGGSAKNEDLFVFSVKHVTLKKGERMVLPVAEYALKYRDVYTLEMPFAPPREVRSNAGLTQEQQMELSRLLNSPKVMHKMRIANSSQHPLTTAPALIMSGDRVIAQGLMTYTPLKGSVDLALTTAVDIGVKKSEKETSRKPNAEEWQGNRFGRVDMEGKISLTNSRGTPVEVEVNRYVLGQVDKADHDGQATMMNAFEDDGFAGDADQPYWWRWYNWPYWWHHFNGVGRFNWTVKLDPGKSMDLGYAWHYYWQ
jgi:hypothetical protein